MHDLSDPSSKAMRPAIGIAVMGAGMVILASTDAVSKHLTLGFAVVQILWVRYVIFAAMGTWLAWRKAGFDGFRTRMPVAQVARALILNAANFTFVSALARMEMADAHSIWAVAPLMIVAASAPLLGEWVGPRRWAAVALGFVGMLIILRPGLGVFDLTALIPVAGACFFAAYTILTKIISRQDPHETTLFHTGWIGLACLSIFAPFYWTVPDSQEWGLLILAGFGGTIAHVCIIVALHLAPANVLQPFNYTMLVWATVLGYLVFGDLPDTFTIFGAAIIVASGLYAWHRERIAVAN